MHHHNERTDSVARKTENVKRRVKIRIMRKNIKSRTIEEIARKEKRSADKLNPDSIYSDYLRQIKQGPTNVCTCCGCLYFRKTVILLNRERIGLNNPSSKDFFQVCLSYYI